MFTVEDSAEGVRTLWMDDGKVNAIGADFLAQFPEAWAKATSHGGAVVLASRRKAFCAGIDLKLMLTLDESGCADYASDLMRMLDLVRRHERPVVAALDGAAIAGGAVLALCADVRIAGARAKMGVTEVAVGVPFPKPVANLVTSRLPPQEHAPALLEGVTRGADELVARGWAHRSEGDAHAAAVETAARLADFSPLAYGGAKRLLIDSVDWTFDAKAWAAELMSEETKTAVMKTMARLAGAS